MADATSERSRLATVFGGSGFLGRHIVRALVAKGLAGAGRGAAAGSRRLPADRSAASARSSRCRPICAIRPRSRHALEGAEMVVNAAGVRAESGAQTYRAVHVDGSRRARQRSQSALASKLMSHVSGIGADADSASPYIASKGRGEAATLDAYPDATILRPVGRVRTGGRFLQPFRRARSPFAGHSPVRRRRDASAAGLCRRRRASGGGGARRRRNPALPTNSAVRAR